MKTELPGLPPEQDQRRDLDDGEEADPALAPAGGIGNGAEDGRQDGKDEGGDGGDGRPVELAEIGIADHAGGEIGPK